MKPDETTLITARDRDNQAKCCVFIIFEPCTYSIPRIASSPQAYLYSARFCYSWVIRLHFSLTMKS